MSVRRVEGPLADCVARRGTGHARFLGSLPRWSGRKTRGDNLVRSFESDGASESYEDARESRGGEICEGSAARMLIVLVGPKGSGKTHIGRFLERTFGVHFFHVEPFWMAYHAECAACGASPTVEAGMAKIRPLLAEAISGHHHVCVETTGASGEIVAGLMGLAPRSEILVVRVRVPLNVCLERIAGRDPTDQVPMDLESVRAIHQLSESLELSADIEIENTDPDDSHVARSFARLCRADRS